MPDRICFDIFDVAFAVLFSLGNCGYGIDCNFNNIFGYSISFFPDKNKPLDDIEKGIYRNLSVIATIIAISLIIISFFLNLMEIFYAVAWSLSADAVLILLAIIRRCKNEEDDLEGSSNNC